MVRKSIEDLFDAAITLDYDGLLACLNDDIDPDSGKEDRYSSAIWILRAACKANLADKDAVKCIRLVHEHGADLNYTWNDGYKVLDAIEVGEVEEGSERNVHGVVKYILTHGGHNGRDRDSLICELSKHNSIMTKEEFERFEQIGDTYLKAKEEGIELNVDDAKAVERYEKQHTAALSGRKDRKKSVCSRLKQGEVKGRPCRPKGNLK